MTRLAALTLGALAACAGTTGTIRLDLATAPGSHLLDGVERLRVTLTEPHQVVEATRTARGFELALEVDAGESAGALIVEGFDAAGARIACGQSPRFPVTGITAHIVVYVAPPSSIALAPVALGAARSEVAAAPLAYGAVIAGGLEAGAPSAAIAVYNAFDHTLADGRALPAPRAGLAIAAGSAGGVYLFGGTGPDGAPTGTLWRFDTTVPDHGEYRTVTDQAGYARAGQLMVAIGPEHFLITGAPPLELDAGTLSARGDVAGLPAAGAPVGPGDSSPTAIFAGAALVRFRGGSFDTLSADGRSDAAATTLPDGRVAVIGGAATDALVIDGATGAVTTVPGALSTPRIRPAIATTSRHVVVAGGSDGHGAPIASADVLDARTLTRLATPAMLPRTGGFAVALPDDQVLLGGGVPASPALELFTPEPP